MIINKITLRNFTSYEGEYVFNFANDKRFNLINGENGNGKTSLLKSIVFGLYGSKMYDSTHVTKQYKDFILSALNNSTKENYFLVELNFDYQNINYNISRKVLVNKKRDNFEEYETILADNVVVKECPLLSEYSKDVIELFFFNGETILDIIKSNKFNSYIHQLISISFNLKTFEQLDRDISKSIGNEFKEISTDKYDSLLSQLKQLEEKLTYNEKEKKHYSQTLENDELNYKFAINEMKNHGVLLSDEVQKHTFKEQELKGKKSQIDEEFTEYFIDGTFNNLLLSKINKKQSKLLDETREDRVQNLIKKYQNIKDDNEFQYEDIDYNLEKYIIHKASVNSQEIGDKLLEKTMQYAKHEKQINSIRKKLAKSEEGQKYVDFNDNIAFYTENIQKVSKILSQIENNNDAIKNEMETLRGNIEVEKKEMLKSSLQSNAFNEKEKLIKIVREYQDVKLKEIIELINAELNYVLKDVLLRKSNLIDTIKIIDGELKITQKKKNVDFTNFSAGEQQLLIVGVILSILKTSRNMNPLVLDTFIGRLDSDHTKNILGFLQNEIENQIIILTTDREVTEKEYQMIKDDINISYRLDNDGYKTMLTEGYFNYEN